ncbi:MAG: hypothetical protein INF93_09975 [Rhodobacter sp.]|nr:hypothetical protein [Rhodobacter sp.]
MSILSALIGACVALLVSTVLYRWQKMVDRETLVQTELRVLYAKFLAAGNSAYLEQPLKGDHAEVASEKMQAFFSISAREQDLYTLRDQIVLLAPNEVVNEVRRYDDAFRKWKIAFPQPGEESPDNIQEARNASDELRKQHKRLISVLRDSLRKQQRFALFPFNAGRMENK